MPVIRQPEPRENKPLGPVTLTETPEQYAMGPKPPPVTFDMIEDLGRICASIKAMAELGGSKADEQTLRRLSRLVMIEREMRQIVHADILFKRSNINDDTEGSALFPHYRSFPDVRDGGGLRLIVQDLQAVWDGTKWVGDGACTFNKWHHGGGRQLINWMGERNSPVEAETQHYQTVWPQQLLLMHTSMSMFRVGERNVSGRQFIPPMQNFAFFDLKPGDYITGELYVEIC